MPHAYRQPVPAASLLLAAMILMALPPIGNGQPPKNYPPVNEKGPEFSITESYNTGSTGYLLALTRMPEGLHVVVTEDVGPSQPVPGAPSHRTYRMLASKPNVKMTLAHFRPWDPAEINASNYSVTVQQVEPLRPGKVQLTSLHVEPGKQFDIKVDHFPQYQLILHTMTEGIYLVRTEHEAPAQPIPGAPATRIYHFYAAPGFATGKVSFIYYVPGIPDEGVTVEYDVRTANNDFDRMGIVCRPAAGGEGLEILDVAQGAPADEYRLRKGDIILSVNAEETNQVDAYLKLIAKPGPFFHVRGQYSNGKPFEFTCQLPVLPDAPAPAKQP